MGKGRPFPLWPLKDAKRWLWRGLDIFEDVARGLSTAERNSEGHLNELCSRLPYTALQWHMDFLCASEVCAVYREHRLLIV